MLEISRCVTISCPWIQLGKLFQSLCCFKAKGFFPYDYFTHADQLDKTTLPTYETLLNQPMKLYSTIKNCNILEQEHTVF